MRQDVRHCHDANVCVQIGSCSLTMHLVVPVAILSDQQGRLMYQAVHVQLDAHAQLS